MNLFDESDVVRCTSAAVLRHRAFLAFGGNGKPTEPLSSIRAYLPGELLATWENYVAAESLLTERSGSSGPDKPKPESRPCGPDGPTYGQLRGLPFAAALFPLASNAGPPQLGRVWCFSLPGARKRLPQPVFRLDGWSEFLNALPNSAKFRFYFDLPAAAAVTGRSWQLAARLAAILSAPVLGPQALELAANWIVTGSVDAAGVIHPVKAGNKALLIHSTRRWLYSAKSPGFEQTPGHTVARVDEARAHIINTPIPLPAEFWPSQIRVMHMLVGEKTQAQEAAALIPDAIERIVLWHSENEARSARPARMLRARISEIHPDAEVEMSLLSANSLVAMQEMIAIRLLPDLEQATFQKPVFFNVTSGNRLMFFAVAMLAQQPRNNRKMRLIYRERDTPALCYIQIRYTDAGPDTLELRLPPAFPADKRETVKILLSPPENEKKKCFTDSRDMKNCLKKE